MSRLLRNVSTCISGTRVETRPQVLETFPK